MFFFSDLEFVKTFLYTYQSFATPEKLLKKLIERYNVVRPEQMPFQEFTMLRQTIQARVINALRLWVDLSVDFKGISVNVGYFCMSVCQCVYDMYVPERDQNSAIHSTFFLALLGIVRFWHYLALFVIF